MPQYPFVYNEDVIVGGKSLPASNLFTGSGRHSICEDLVPNDTLFLPDFALDVSSIVAIAIYSPVNVAFTTLLVDATKNTLNLLGGDVYVWHNRMLCPCLLTLDFDNVEVVEAAGGTGEITIEVIYDATPPV